MSAICDGFVEAGRLISRPPFVSALFGPVFGSGPVRVEGRTGPNSSSEAQREPGGLHEIFQIVCVHPSNEIGSGREVVEAGLTRDARFQRAFHSIPAQVVGTVIETGVEQMLCLSQSDAGDSLEIAAIHGAEILATRPRWLSGQGRDQVALDDRVGDLRPLTCLALEPLQRRAAGPHRF